jgi:hypothetical protein
MNLRSCWNFTVRCPRCQNLLRGTKGASPPLDGAATGVDEACTGRNGREGRIREKESNFDKFCHAPLLSALQADKSVEATTSRKSREE